MRRALLVLAWLALCPPPSQAQLNDEQQGFMSELLQLSEGINSGNARDMATKCEAMRERLKALQGLSGPQQLAFESEIERCLYMAMNNGKFSDKTGDECSHHYAFTEKYAGAVDGWLKVEGTQGEFMANLALQLDSAMRMGPELGCKGDYTVFAATLAAAQEAAKSEARAPDMEFMGEILSVTQEITPETAKDAVAKCNALSDKYASKENLFETEKNYYPSLIENCLSVAMEKGAAADANGDACAHLYNHADGLVRTLAAAKSEAQWFEAYSEIYRDDLKSSIAHAQELRCAQDFAGLKAD